jgi:hypothetical protein
VFVRTGNTAALAQLWPYMTALMAFIDAAAAATGGLLAFGPYADWLGPEKASDAFTENFYVVNAAGQMAEMAAALGRPAEAAAYTALAAAVGDAMAKALFDPAVGWDHGTNQNAQAMALAVGLAGAVTANATATIVAAMVADVNAHGAHPTGGLASTRWILQGLVAGGQPALALAMATVPTAPGWAYMSTPDMPGTIWEQWTGNAHESDGSKNHPMFSGMSHFSAPPVLYPADFPSVTGTHHGHAQRTPCPHPIQAASASGCTSRRSDCASPTASRRRRRRSRAPRRRPQPRRRPRPRPRLRRWPPRAWALTLASAAA